MTYPKACNFSGSCAKAPAALSSPAGFLVDCVRDTIRFVPAKPRAPRVQALGIRDMDLHAAPGEARASPGIRDGRAGACTEEQ
jgi:hypothetical protein